MLRPIHVIQSGLTRLGRGELDVTLDLPGEEFRDLGTSFEAVSAQLSAVRDQAVARRATDFESVMENLEDAVALFSPGRGDLHQRGDARAAARSTATHPAMQSLDRPDARRPPDAGPVLDRAAARCVPATDAGGRRRRASADDATRSRTAAAAFSARCSSRATSAT